ncbi:MAG: hydroxymethylglutaryl-CoA reductase, degradative [Anaerolineales bacterium]|nr:hydroxymethylglutaryl-CoA reductase, degradative [Anaerolineales bacterium]MCB9143060.1 hydroxymethylglutaryl-CoA reductase, degradative [Anaerolineales bacterium]
MPEKKTSRLSGFYAKPLTERIAAVSEWAELSVVETATLSGGLTPALANQMVENAIGMFALPFGIGVNLLINGRDYLAPMAVEEPSVIAAVGNAARLARAGGGFQTGSTPSVMIGQVQLLDVPDLAVAAQAVLAADPVLGKLVDSQMPSMVARGGGFRGIEVRPLHDTPVGPMLIVHLLIDCMDAMGANVINTAVEAVAPLLESLTGGRANLRILSNLTDRRRAWAECTIPVSAFATDPVEGFSVAKGIADANAFAWADPYRAATHNKGIMNGIDPIAIATGNDWRAIEAGAHAYAARDGQYRSLTDWRLVDGSGGPALFGRIELPLAVGIVGGATRVHPTAQTALKILGVTTARELAEVMAAVGLAQNLGALRALAAEGIQHGHMALHARQAALAAGVPADQVDRVAAQLVAEENVKASRAAEIWAAQRGEDNEQ